MSHSPAPHHLERVRTICFALENVSEQVSHGAPTFFVKKKVFVMFADNHHNDGRVAAWIPVQIGFQETLIASDPQTFFKPPYVGVKGWVGIELSQINDEDLEAYIHEAWHIITSSATSKKKRL